MITFLACPKPFTGNTRIQQMNAIRSWLTTTPDAEVILYGGAEGSEEALALPNVRTGEVPLTETGTVLFADVAAHARQHGRHDVQCYINSDIMLTQSFGAMLSIVPKGPFLVVGERLNMPENIPLDFDDPTWIETAFDAYRRGEAKPAGPTAIDYFVFRRGQWQDLPYVAMGRAFCDGALLAHSLRKRTPIIDVTRQVLAVHQFHGYGHVQGGKQRVWHGDEAKRNQAENGVAHSPPTVADAQLILERDALSVCQSRDDQLRAAEIHLRFCHDKAGLANLFRAAWRIRKKVQGKQASELSPQFPQM